MWWLRREFGFLLLSPFRNDLIRVNIAIKTHVEMIPQSHTRNVRNSEPVAKLEFLGGAQLLRHTSSESDDCCLLLSQPPPTNLSLFIHTISSSQPRQFILASESYDCSC
jgi:hypothetical protein